MKYFLFCFFLFSCQSKSIERHIKEAELSVASGDFEKAASRYHNLAQDYEEHPESVAWLMQSAELLELRLHDEEALKRYQQVVEKNPLGNFGKEARKRRAALFERLGLIQEYLEEYTQLLKYYGSDAEAPLYRLRIAEGFIMADQYEQARLELKTILFDPDFPKNLLEQAFFDLGETFYLQDRYHEAQNIYEEFLRRYPLSTLSGEVYLKLSHTLEVQGYLGDAYRVLLLARDLYPDPAVIEERLKRLAKRARITPFGKD